MYYNLPHADKSTTYVTPPAEKVQHFLGRSPTDPTSCIINTHKSSAKQSLKLNSLPKTNGSLCNLSTSTTNPVNSTISGIILHNLL